jgi:branched-chain amino acid transport system permease protein
VAEDETGARLIGIDVAQLHTLTFALSAMLAAVAGASLLSITPAEPFVGVGPLNRAYFVVILAGFGNVMGSVLGGFIIGVIETLAYYFLGAGWQDILSLVILILILLVKPAGLFGMQLKGV